MLNAHYSTKYWNLSRRLIQHCESSYTFFDKNLLKIILETLDYPGATISKYLGGNFCGIISYSGRDNFDTDEYYEYYNDFRINDPFAKALTKYSNINNVSIPVLLSSQILSSTDLKIYNNHLKRYGLGWSAGIHFGMYRLVLNKNIDDNDFSKDEIEFLKFIGELLYTKSIDFSRCIGQRAYFNSLQIGKIICSDNGEIIDLNDYSLHFLQTSYGLNKTSDLPKLIISLFEEKKDPSTPPFSPCQFTANGHKFTISNSIIQDGFGHITKTYYVLIERTQMFNSISTSITFKEKYSLSSRETDVLVHLSNGLSLNEISNSLHISLGTVRTHLKNIFNKTETNSQRLLIKKYIQESSF